VTTPVSKGARQGERAAESYLETVLPLKGDKRIIHQDVVRLTAGSAFEVAFGTRLPKPPLRNIGTAKDYEMIGFLSNGQCCPTVEMTKLLESGDVDDTFKLLYNKFVQQMTELVAILMAIHARTVHEDMIERGNYKFSEGDILDTQVFMSLVMRGLKKFVRQPSSRPAPTGGKDTHRGKGGFEKDADGNYFYTIRPGSATDGPWTPKDGMMHKTVAMWLAKLLVEKIYFQKNNHRALDGIKNQPAKYFTSHKKRGVTAAHDGDRYDADIACIEVYMKEMNSEEPSVDWLVYGQLFWTLIKEAAEALGEKSVTLFEK
jgi:hypothetical protein